ncbi:DNA translocase FtsK [Alkaliphilus pronyensis]|uniref:DNA translocase FtsK n=1 Tax=Alkaliphilus pronyensis TaxID=1482732 RepID=A0A6I0FCH1_9FIRM|nr:FtsK/SpoIIIE domain-containing protein [Alkaliphilus pronyensis]KAB3535645.1 DNA translocase FtsK [Alkaliphilus pronyensis]
MAGRSEEEIVGMYIYNFFRGIFNVIKTIFYGIKKLPEDKKNYYKLLIWIAFGVGLFLLREKIWSYIPQDNKRLMILRYGVYATPLIPLFYLYIKGSDHMKFISDFDEKFDEIGLFTKGKKKDINGNMVEKKIYPKYLSEEKEGDITTFSFYSNIPLEEWRFKEKKIENMLDCNILKIENALTTKKIVKVKTVPASKIIPIYIDWKDEYLSSKDFEIIVGENMLEQVKFNLNSTPHVLVAGETGSGKSVILRMILRQAVLKAAKIFMIDFKGGVEFGIRYERYGEVITERQRALHVLKELVSENEARLKLFRSLDVKNLGEYNNIAEDKGLKKLCRIMVFCDEVAEMMDKSGLGRNAKQIFEEIEKEISTLARLSRATGINLILGMQRPDAKVLPGQIKNNIPVRISGRFSDKPASEIVLSNSKATELPETKGRFMFKVGADTLEFQAYNFNDSVMLSDVEVAKGGMLTQNLDDEWEIGGEEDNSNLDNPYPEGPVYEEDFADEEDFEYEGFEEEDNTDYEDEDEDFEPVEDEIILEDVEEDYTGF